MPLNLERGEVRLGWDFPACPRFSGVSTHHRHHFPRKFFPNELEVVQMAGSAIIMGYFHAATVVDAYHVPNIRSNDCPPGRYVWHSHFPGVGVYALDLHIVPRSGFCVPLARSSTT